MVSPCRPDRSIVEFVAASIFVTTVLPSIFQALFRALNAFAAEDRESHRTDPDFVQINHTGVPVLQAQLFRAVTHLHGEVRGQGVRVRQVNPWVDQVRIAVSGSLVVAMLLFSKVTFAATGYTSLDYDGSVLWGYSETQRTWEPDIYVDEPSWAFPVFVDTHLS